MLVCRVPASKRTKNKPLPAAAVPSFPCVAGLGTQVSPLQEGAPGLAGVAEVWGVGGHRLRDEKGKGQRFDSEHPAITGEGHFLSTSVGAKHQRSPKTQPQGSVCLTWQEARVDLSPRLTQLMTHREKTPRVGSGLLAGPSESLQRGPVCIPVSLKESVAFLFSNRE